MREIRIDNTDPGRCPGQQWLDADILGTVLDLSLLPTYDAVRGHARVLDIRHEHTPAVRVAAEQLFARDHGRAPAPADADADAVHALAQSAEAGQLVESGTPDRCQVHLRTDRADSPAWITVDRDTGRRHQWGQLVRGETPATYALLVLDGPSHAEAEAAKPAVADGPLDLPQLQALTRQIDHASQARGGTLHQRLAQALRQVDTAPPRPDLERLLTGRIARNPLTGRWAAWAGDVQLGEHRTSAAAAAALQAARAAELRVLQTWLAHHLAGTWHLDLPQPAVTVQDRVCSTEAAALLGLSDTAWRSALARGDLPPPDGRTPRGAPWWHRSTLDPRG
jgi:hypothetical protein